MPKLNPQTSYDEVEYTPKSIYVTDDTLVDIDVGSRLDLYGDVYVNGSRMFSTVIDIRTFGAKSDGITNDAPAVQAAIDSLGGARGIVLFPNGITLFNANLDSKRAYLQGQGKPPNVGGGGTTLKFNSTFGIKSSLEDNTSWQVRDMTIQGSGDKVTNGQVLVDFTGCNCPRLSNVRIDQSHYGLRLAKGSSIECNYGIFDQVDVWRCTRGVDFGNGTIGANSHVFTGGRVWSCTTGWYIDSTVNNVTANGVAFECGSGATAVDSAGTTVTFMGCRFETLLNNLVVRSGGGRHWMLGCHHSSGFDVVDANSPTVVYGLADSPDLATAIPLAGGGYNIVSNGAFLGGTTVGWLTTYSTLGTGFTFTAASGDATVGTYATLTNTGTTNPRAYQVFSVVPDETLSIRFKARTSSTLFLMRASATNAGLEWMNQSLTNDGVWHEYRTKFTPTSSTLNLILYRNGATAGSCDIADVSVTVGGQPLPGWQPSPLSEVSHVHLGTTVGFYGATPVVKAANPGTAAGADAAVLNAVVTALRNLGLVT